MALPRYCIPLLYCLFASQAFALRCPRFSHHTTSIVLSKQLANSIARSRIRITRSSKRILHGVRLNATATGSDWLISLFGRCKDSPNIHCSLRLFSRKRMISTWRRILLKWYAYQVTSIYVNTGQIADFSPKYLILDHFIQQKQKLHIGRWICTSHSAT